MNFALFQRPTRYIDSEFNSRAKPEPVDVRIALAFPDTYEVGMSHLGLRILYDIINNLPFAAAERVFAPWSDLREYMNAHGMRLASLETKRPLSDFDMIGFSLQYELSYTTALDMLALSGIPFRTAERMQSKQPFPIIIAGGPSTVNPAPMSPFIDAFLIGDGEEAVVQMLEAVRQAKANSEDREGILQAISDIEGFYVPHIHGNSIRIKRRFVADLDSVPFPEKQIVPYASIVHDRVNVEVARGCTMGCRFCQAGMIYRPARERSPENVLKIARNAISNTGYDEISFSSLSTGDYSCLLPLIRGFNRSFGQSRTAVSLPSLRVGSVSRDVLKEIRSVRKTGFTMAPEAATERLRRVINKDFTDEDYERALIALFEEGWLTLKLYFMIGLPTEREEDINAISEMAMKALRIAKKSSGKFVNINITVSPFIPKPHTPFQWQGQISLDEIRRKLGILRQVLRTKKFKYKGHDERMSFLEAVFARGDAQLAGLIEEAWRNGCRLDGWSEYFDFSKWQQAMEKTGIDGASYAGRFFSKDDPLPWDNIDIGVSKDFLYSEYSKSVDEMMTPNCGRSCSACGLQCRNFEESAVTISSTNSDIGIQEKQIEPDSEPAAAASGKTQLTPRLRIRSCFSKTGMLRYLSHLELITAVTRALRRAEVPVDYTKGFHPNPEISFGPPLNVGVAGTSEYFDMEVFAPFDVQLYRTLLNSTLPDGLRINEMQIIPATGPSLTGFVSRYEFIIGFPVSSGKNSTGSSVPVPPDPGSPIIVLREGKEKDISPCIESVERIDTGDEAVRAVIGQELEWAWRVILKDAESVRVRLGEITMALLGNKMESLVIIRIGMYGWKDEWRRPL
jgi:radical SAM family uncharacterized protein/radical SAM-linked protein